MSDRYHRSIIFPEQTLPDAAELIEQGRSVARTVTVGDCAFLSEYRVSCEAEYKNQCAANAEVMVHCQIGYRDPNKTGKAYREIWQKAGERGARVDRYGICLDWSMGYRQADRVTAQRGTGLILPDEGAFSELTSLAPVAPHFGDFVLGMPSALENSCAALRAGSTAIGNLGQYFTFRLPGWDNDIEDTAATLKAIALITAQPVEVLVHSNLDDGFAALFTDLACSLGAVLLEKTIVEELLGGSCSHCYGHSFSEPYKRLVFQLALATVSDTPGTMVYGNTVMYDGDGTDNYAALGSYLTIDAVAQRIMPTGHAINPIPVTEASRIPDIDEVIDAAVFARRTIEQADDFVPLFSIEKAQRDASRLVTAAHQFKTSVLEALELAGIDTNNPFELLLALRRTGARKLEQDFGPGQKQETASRGRVPIMQASTISRLEESAERKVNQADPNQVEKVRKAGLAVCICTTDVHEYGKILLEETLRRMDVTMIDAGVHAEPDAIACLVAEHKIDAIAVSTYNGIALDYLQNLRKALGHQNLECPIIMGGKTNQIQHDSSSSLPVDVSGALVEQGAIVCRTMDDLIPELAILAAANE